MPSSESYTIRLQPIGVEVRAQRGAPLRELLFEQGVEFPCGGNGRCRGCKIQVLKGEVAVNDAQREHLSEAELAAGWRLSCQCEVTDDLVLELRQWDATILTNDAAFEFAPQDGLGVAVDVGTTTVVAQLLDLRSGQVLGVRTALNPQAVHGGDVMSRVQFAVAESGHDELSRAIRHEVGRLIHQLFAISSADREQLRRVVLVGNTVMHHLFCGIDLTPLAYYPFEPVDDGLQVMTAAELGWPAPGSASVEFLPCLGSFVGSDILAGILATGIARASELTMLVDLGTNGEIVVTSGDTMYCASTAAGPAFEGARISMGMRAATGAIWKASVADGAMRCEVLGNVEPRGVCGSGLVDVVAAGLDLGQIGRTGRLAAGDAMPLAGPVTLSQTDVRQLQLAKGAIAAGIRIMLGRIGAAVGDIGRVYLAGAFGNYVNRTSAQRIGLLQMPLERIQPVGNTALLGAKIALFRPPVEQDGYAGIRERMVHVGLNEDPAFQEVYVEEMGFPAAACAAP